MRIPRRIDVVFFTVVLLSGLKDFGVGAECDESLINGFDKDTMIRIGKQKFQCKETDKALRITTGPISNAKELTCLRNWLADGHSTGIPGAEQITVTGCFETECDENKITKGEGVLFNKGPPVTLNCSDNKFIVLNGTAYDKLMCNKTWVDERGTTIHEANAKFKVTCEEKACHPGAVFYPKGAIREKNEIKCRNPEFELKDKRSDPRYASKLMCDKKAGWTNEYGEFIRSAEYKFLVNCVRRTCYEDLLNISDSAHFALQEPNEKKDFASIFCKKKDQVLYIEGNFYEYLMCKKEKKWTDGTNEIQSHSFNVDCVEKACHPGLLRDITSEEVDKSVPNKLSCKDLTKELIIRNTTFYAAELRCDKGRGWTVDSSPLTVAKNDSRIDVECVERTCHESLINSSDIAQFKFESDSNEFNKRILTCKEQGKFLFFENTFYDSLECVKTEEWPVLGRKANETLSMKCAAKACHESWLKLDEGVKRHSNALTCEEPSQELHINGTLHYSEKLVCEETVGWNNGVEKSVTIKGAEDDFTVECVGKVCDKRNVEFNSSNVEIRSSDNNSIQAVCINSEETLYHEEIRETLVCDQQIGWKDGNSSINIGPREKIAIQCVEKNKSCKDSFFEIDTKCQAGWKDCHEINISNLSTNYCPEGKHLFYKEKGATYFKGQKRNGASKDVLHCDRVKGWNVKFEGIQKTLEKGVVVICAVENPLPSIVEKTTKAIHEPEITEQTTARTNDSINGNVNASGITSSKDSANSPVSSAENKKSDIRFLIIIVCSVIGVLILIIIVTVIIKQCAKRDRTEKSDGSSNKLIDEKKSTGKGDKENDKILDDTSFEAPSEIKL